MPTRRTDTPFAPTGEPKRLNVRQGAERPSANLQRITGSLTAKKISTIVTQGAAGMDTQAVRNSNDRTQPHRLDGKQ